MVLINELFLNYYFLSFIIAWILSVIIKTGLVAWDKKKNPEIADGLKNGGMPSSHSSLVSAITCSILLTQGFSSLFFVSLAFSLIIVSDAFILRRNVGLQAEELNKLLKKAKQKPVSVVHGHTFMQVIAGIFLGILTSFLLFVLFF